MGNEMAALSEELAAAVERAGQAVVAVHARPRFSSSGVFWHPGIVVTAEHTIRNEEEITVTLPNGSNVAATLAGSDAGTDVAVLRVEGNISGPTPRAGEAPAPGSLALAIGRSRDSGVNASMGVISAVSGSWRTWRGGRLDHYIRLDLRLFPNSSGGVVVNVAGEAIGIATSALSRIAGVAIPATTVDRVVGEILTRGRVARGYLGLGLQPVQLPDHHKGLIVLSLESGGPAAKAGVLIGDILLSLGGETMADTDDVQGVLESHGAGQNVEAEVLRGGTPKKIVITVEERPGRS
jgi:S1-C subfamily serine protease